MKKERLAALVAIFLSGGANNSTTCVSFSIMPTFAKNEKRGHCMVVNTSGHKSQVAGIMLSTQ
jgi:hypothetical protein